jgi:Xaa-Pro aminopeptidase
MDHERLDAFVVSSPPNLRYLTGFTGSAGMLVVTARDARLVVDGRYASGAREGAASGGLAAVAVEPVPQRYDLALAEQLTRLAIRRAGFEPAAVTVATLGAWRRAAPAIEWVETAGAVEAMRAVKDAGEIGILREAAVRLSDVARALPTLVRAAATERDVARAIDRALERAGFERPAFDTIVASGPRSARPHVSPSDRRLTSGDLVVLDFGGVLDGYCVDLTRMAAVGRPVERALRLVHAVRESQEAAIETVAPGISGVAVDGAARRVLERHGLGEAFLHGTGHGLGLEVHEAPRLSRTPEDDVRLVEGMVCTIEPGAYVEGLGGARLEDDVLVTASGREVLTNAPRELLII